MECPLLQGSLQDLTVAREVHDTTTFCDESIDPPQRLANIDARLVRIDDDDSDGPLRQQFQHAFDRLLISGILARGRLTRPWKNQQGDDETWAPR